MKQLSRFFYSIIINLYIASCLYVLVAKTETIKTESSTETSSTIKEPVTSAFKIRPPGLNGAQKIAGESPGIITHTYHEPENQFPAYDNLLLGSFPSRIFSNKNNLFISTTGSYRQSIQPTVITHALFGSALVCDKLLIQGSSVEDRNPKALLADYFYLPDTYESAISFNPIIETTTANLNLYARLNNPIPGLYARVYAHYVHAHWNLDPQEKKKSDLDGTVAAGRFSPLEMPAENLLPNALSFFAGFAPQPIEPPQTGVIGTDHGAYYPITREELSFPLFNCQNKSMQALSEIRYELGYDCWQAENSHLGIYLAGAIPSFMNTGRCSLFHPQTDNNDHLEMGAGFSGHYQVWQSTNENQQLSICADAQITHLFNTKEFRSFDLKNKPLSRYMLAAKHMPIDDGGLNELSGSVQRQAIITTFPTENPFKVGPHKAGFQFDNTFAPIGNLTEQQVSVSINAQIDATIWLNYVAHGFTVDLGYNLWLQTAEKITCCGKSRLETEPYWASHGDALVFSYFPTDFQDIDLTSREQALAIAASQSDATVHTGTNIHAQGLPLRKGALESFPSPIPGTTDQTPFVGQLNGGSDNAQFASAIAADGKASWLSNTNDPDEQSAARQRFRQTMLSLDPIFLSPSDILINPKQSHMSHKFFGALGYTFDSYYATPYIGIGAEIEFGSTNTHDTRTCHLAYAISKWGAWGKIALFF